MLTRLIFVAMFLNCFLIQAQTQIENFSKDNALTSNQINCYLVDSKGLVWIGTESGLNAYSAEKWYPIKAITDDQTGKDVQIGNVEKIFEDSKRNIWVSTKNGIFMYNSKYWVHYLQEEEEKLTAKDIMEDRQGRIWFSLENIKKFEDFSNLQITKVSGVVYMFDYDSWYYISQMTGSVALKYNIPPKFFTSVLQDREGNIWISSLEGLYRFYGEGIIEIGNDELKSIKSFRVVQDSKGDIWVATESGVFRFRNNAWIKYGKKEGLGGDFFYDIKVDPAGRIWAFSAIDMKFTGLSAYYGDRWQQYDNDAIQLKGSIENLLWWENEALAFSKSGVSRFDSTGWHRFDRKEGLTDNKYSLMVRDRFKNIWLAGSNGIYQYHNKNWIKLFEPDDEWVVNEIFSDKKENLWIATEDDGVYEFSKNNWKQISIENGLPDNNVSEVFEDKNENKWFITKKGIAKTNFPSE